MPSSKRVFTTPLTKVSLTISPDVSPCADFDFKLFGINHPVMLAGDED
jgi:hypothetical protein